MDLRSAKRKHTLLTVSGTVPTTLINAPPVFSKDIKTTLDEQKSFFTSISKCGSKPAILSLVAPFSDLYVPLEVQLPKPITEQFYSKDDTTSDFPSLLCTWSTITLSINKEECEAIESSTREQANSSVWFKQRAGCITASKLRSVCHTNIESPH